MNSREITEADFINLAADMVGKGLLKTGQSNFELAKEYAKQFRSPDMAGIDQIYSAIESRIRHFESIYHKFEANELRSALDTVRRLVPPRHLNHHPRIWRRR